MCFFKILNMSIRNMLTLTGRERLLLMLFFSVVAIYFLSFQLKGPMENPEKTPCL